MRQNSDKWFPLPFMFRTVTELKINILDFSMKKMGVIITLFILIMEKLNVQFYCRNPSMEIYPVIA
jgi:hypothetical protein